MSTAGIRGRWKRRKDLKGRRFGRLTVLGDLPEPTKSGCTRWKCACDCGRECISKTTDLKRPHPSCGCWGKELQRAAVTKHGMSFSPEFFAWNSMISRCYNPNHASYRRYGGRNIQVCTRWRGSFNDFYSDVGPRPSADHSIDRIDNDGHYSCGRCDECRSRCWQANVRWATRKQQQWNRSVSRMVTAFGRTLPLAQWADEKGLSRKVLAKRLKIGWEPEAALTTPIQTQYRRQYQRPYRQQQP